MTAQIRKFSVVCCITYFFGLTNPLFGADPVIHVEWDESPAPVAGVDYILSTSSPASVDFPDIELVEGSLTWRIWSTDTDYANGVGDIGVISSPHSDNFGVGNPGIALQNSPGFRFIIELCRIEQPTVGGLSAARRRTSSRMKACTSGLLVFLFGATPCVAGLFIEVHASPSTFGLPEGAYFPGERVAVSYLARTLSESDDIPIHYLRLDLQIRDRELGIALPVTDPTNVVRFWRFGTSCGSDCYIIDDDLAGDDLSIMWDFVGSSQSDLPLILPGNGTEIPIGLMEVELPSGPGVYLLDVLNPINLFGSPGAEMRYWVEEQPGPIIWRAQSGEITGGAVAFIIVPEPPTGCLCLLALAFACRRRTRKATLSLEMPPCVAAAYDCTEERCRG